MKTVKQLKHDQYDYIDRYYNYITKWNPYSYRKLKVIIYVNVCALLVYIFLKFKIRPNTVTLLYAFMGLAAGILLSMPYDATVLAAAALFYLRPFLDWADGPLARELRQTSVTGDILDSYGAYLGWAALWAGMGIYLGRTSHPFFYFFAPLAPFFSSVDIYSIARERFVFHYLSKNELQEYNAAFSEKKREGEVSMIQGKTEFTGLKHKIDAVFEHNARTIDFVCLALILEVFMSLRILWFYYLAFLCWQALVFVMRIMILYRGGWAESELDSMRRILYGKPKS